MNLRESLLGSAAGWRLFKVVTRGESTMRRMVAEYIHPGRAETILDVGCGYGDLARYVAPARYVGIDNNARYIEHAQRHSPDNGTFILGDLGTLSDHGLGHFDCAVAIGVLHHLDDEVVTRMMKTVSELVEPSGRFICAEPVWDPAQRTTARVLAALDRGRFVRDADGYRRMIEPWFPDVSIEIRNDLFWFPYTHCMVTATFR